MEEHDEKMAAKSLIDEACELSSEWIRETADRHLAKTIADRLLQEDRMERDAKTAEGEAFAIRVAIEERQRIAREAQRKADQEKADHAAARRVVLDDVDRKLEKKHQIDEDVAAAESLQKLLQDEMLAEDIANAERRVMEEYKSKMRSIEEADLELAERQQAEFDRVARNERATVEDGDFELACRVQRESDRDSFLQKKKCEQTDSAMARKMQVKALREEHRSKTLARFSKFMNAEDTPESVSKQWSEADAEVDDVAEGICITILLPYMNDLKVHLANSHKIEILARRLKTVQQSVRPDAEFKETTEYNAEFEIDGAGVKIAETQLSYEYCSSSGLLHVYVDNLQLRDQSAVSKSTILDSLRSSFRRLLG